jgi:flagellar biosynthesis protein FlhA
MADYAERVKDTDSLGELVRSEISRTITRQNLDGDTLYCLTLDPKLEDRMMQGLQATTLGSVIVLDPRVREQVVTEMRNQAEKSMVQGQQPVLLCGNPIRLPLRRLIEHELPFLQVMAYNEVASKVNVEIVGAVSVETDSMVA